MQMDCCLGEGSMELDASKLSWEVVSDPDRGVVSRSVPTHRGPDDRTWLWMTAALAAEPALRSLGWSGPYATAATRPSKSELLRQRGEFETIYNSQAQAGAENRNDTAMANAQSQINAINAIINAGAYDDFDTVPNPALISWLRDRGYTLKLAIVDRGGKRETLYGSLWDRAGKLVGISGFDQSSKTPLFGKIVIGVIAVMTGAAIVGAATGAFAASSTAGTAAGTTAAAAAVPAAAAAAPAAAVAVAPAAATIAPAVAAGGAAASSLIPSAATVATVAKAVIPVATAIKQMTAPPSSRASTVAPPAGMVSQMLPEPTQTIPKTTYDSSIFASQSPSWLVPAALGGLGLLALLMMKKRAR